MLLLLLGYDGSFELIGIVSPSHMSAYGAIHRAVNHAILPPTFWHSLSKINNDILQVVIFHFNLAEARSVPGLIAYLYGEFADEIERGTTYPQQTIGGVRYTLEEFEAYIFAADVFLAVQISDEKTQSASFVEKDGDEVALSFEDVLNRRSCQESVLGYYYIKPNYPGRSSHICNAGFVVPYSHRARGVGRMLARSYLHYAPKLGYRASVFNLVYINNIASVRLWDSLGFQRAGLIPGAGCETRLNNDGKETKKYIDAIVFYKSFV